MFCDYRCRMTIFGTNTAFFEKREKLSVSKRLSILSFAALFCAVAFKSTRSQTVPPEGEDTKALAEPQKTRKRMAKHLTHST